MKKSNGIIAYTIIIAIVIALIFFFQRSLYTQTNVTYSQYRSFVEEEKIAQAQIEQNAKVPTGSVLFLSVVHRQNIVYSYQMLMLS